jgi:hypothetical protein
VAFKSTDFKSHFVILNKEEFMERITSLEQLKKESTYDDKKGMAAFFIQLNFGLRSSKRITYFPDTNTFDIYNEIDDSWKENLNEEQLRNETHIVLAIENGALFKYEY